MSAHRSLHIVFRAFLAVLFVLLFAAQSMGQEKTASPQRAAASAAQKARVAANYGHIPLSFEANRGQTDSSVQFLSRGQGYTLFLRQGEAVLALRSARPSSAKTALAPDPRDPHSRFGPKPEGIETSLVRMKLIGANPRAAVREEDEQITKTNYFIGNDPAKWRTNVPNYGRVRYAEIYPGIDLVYYGNQSRLEHDFVVSPGADPARIRLALNGAKNLRIDSATGDVIVSTGGGDLRLLKPVSYQETRGIRAPIRSTYMLLARNEVGFKVASYNHAQPLVIDPVLVYSAVFGPLYASSAAVAVDANGNVYVAGGGAQSGFPVTPGAFQTVDNNIGWSFDLANAFVMEMNPTGTALVYSTFLGGNATAGALGIAVDSQGNAYVAGQTYPTPDFPVTPGAFRTSSPPGAAGDWTGFVTKLDPTGSHLIYSTLMAGLGGDLVNALAVDASGSAYVVGFTGHPDFPTTPGAFQTFLRGRVNAFVTKLNPMGTALDYSTFLGGSLGDEASAIAVDGSGNAYITGSALSADFPVTDAAFQTQLAGKQNAFLTKLNPTGSALVYSTYLGGSNTDSGNAVFVDGSGFAYVAGNTWSTNFPVTPGAFESNPPITFNEGFVTKFDITGASLVYSTYLGNGGAQCNAISVDKNGNAYVGGQGASAEFPTTTGAFETTHSNTAFLTKLDPGGDALIYSTHIGDSGDSINGLLADDAGDVIVVGSSGNADFPVTATAFQQMNGNAFVTKFSLGTGTPNSGSVTTLSSSSLGPSPHTPVTFTAHVAPATLTAPPTGTVTFLVNGEPEQTTALDANENATYTTSTLPGWMDTVAARYSGDSTYDMSGDELTVTVSPYVQIGVTGDPNPQTVGAPVIFKVTVRASGSAATPTGTVNLGIDGVSVFTETLPSSGNVSYTTKTLGVGDHWVTASYSGDSTYPSEAAQSIIEPIMPAMTLTASPNPQESGAPVTLTAAPNYNSIVFPTGTVSFSVDGVSVFSGTIPVSTVFAPKVSYTTSTLTPGVHAITATYSGDSNYAPGSAQTTETILPFGFKAIGGSSQKTLYGTPFPVPLSVQLSGPGASLSGIPVTFSGAGLSFFANPVLTDANGQAQTTATPLQVGQLTATATIANGANSTSTVTFFNLLSTRAPLSVRVSYPQFPSTILRYGDAIPTPTAYTIKGFVNGDTPATAVTGAPLMTTPATSTSPVGTYPIDISRGTLAATNYILNWFYPGIIQIYRANLTLAANSYTIQQGQPIPTLGYTITGFVNGETQAIVSGAPVLYTPATSSSPPGVYPIEIWPGSLSAPNYQFPYSLKTNGTLTIQPATSDTSRREGMQAK